MVRLPAVLILAGCMVAAGCGSLSSSESNGAPTPDSSTPEATLPTTLAFNADDCAGFNGLDSDVVPASVLPASMHESIQPVSELFTATEIMGRRAQEKFESIQATIDSDAPTATTASRSEELGELQRFLDAMIDPDLVPVSAALAERIDESCGPTELGALLSEIGDQALRMQVTATAEYCEVLAGLDPGQYALHAPPEHAEWIDAIAAVEEGGSSAAKAGAAGAFLFYRALQCGEDLTELFG